MAISIHGLKDLGKYNSRPLITYEGNQGYCIIIRIKATIEVFLEEFDPSQNYLLSISDIEGYETQFIEFEIWDKNDGPIPGIKLFKDLNIYLEREYCEY